MIALLQRVSSASVSVAGRELAAIGRGLMVLVGVERGDAAGQAARLAERLVAYRVFADGDGRMNLDVRAIGGELLLVPQFTLAADTRRGNRPSFTPAADAQQGETLFVAFEQAVRARYPQVSTGKFGADMQVRLCNDGPVTFWLQVRPDDAP
ncbi:MAG: D-tyrosyl-tRNA(Tyr) deacylase [Gammaproteobacteria bacterium]|nr:D-tyrosyl-tRNA(Tyr) deacylase [Gammaproteobacteria bacterium]